jgi:hypothetical protein
MTDVDVLPLARRIVAMRQRVYRALENGTNRTNEFKEAHNQLLGVFKACDALGLAMTDAQAALFLSDAERAVTADRGQRPLFDPTSSTRNEAMKAWDEAVAEHLTRALTRTD